MASAHNRGSTSSLWGRNSIPPPAPSEADINAWLEIVMVTCAISHAPIQCSNCGGHSPIRPASKVMRLRAERLGPISIEPGRKVMPITCSRCTFRYGSLTGPRISNATFTFPSLLFGIGDAQVRQSPARNRSIHCVIVVSGGCAIISKTFPDLLFFVSLVEFHFFHPEKRRMTSLHEVVLL